MALKQENIIFNRTDENGNTVMQFPITTADNVEGLNKLTGISVGFQYFTTNPNIPVGELPLFGGEFSREAYADLWAWVQTQTGYLISEAAWQAKATANEGNVPFYSDGDGSTTFRVPSLSCWVKGANGVSEVGSYLKAGLPNITGEVLATANVNAYENAIEDSAVFGTNQASRKTIRESSASYDLYSTLGFDASRSNNIYGASNTVQPPSVVGMWLVKAFGTVSNVGNQDIADVSAGLMRVEEKMDEYTDNVAYIEAFVVETWKSGSLWGRKWSNGFIEQGGYQINNKKEARVITFHFPFSTTSYNFFRSPRMLKSSGTYHCVGYQSKTKTTVTFQTDDKGYYAEFDWYACGY